ncbi:MAG: ATP-binding protein, partial [Ginsengibacter sp.]
MADKKLPLIILAAFILGTVLLIYAHNIFTKNNDALIKGNEKVLNEVRVNSQLKDLEKSIITIESTVIGTVVTSDTSYFRGIMGNIAETESDIDQLQRISDDDSSDFYVDKLDTLVQRKVLFSKQILDTFHFKGKYAAENMFNSLYGARLTDSIIKTLDKIVSTRKKHFDDANIAIKKGSQKAQQFITMLIAFVLIGFAVLFWFIINTMRRQGNLIHQLNISEKKTRDSSLVKEKFLANMSHEIRTPINAILGFTNLLQRKKLDKESKEHVETIQKSGEGLLTIINDILDLSKIEAGMMRIESTPFSIRGLVHSVETMFVGKTREKGLEFSTSIDTTMPDILNGDATRLTQMLVNLIGNAIKFTNNGSIAVRITNEGIKDTIVDTGITITDTGIGIEPEKIEKMFERFQQADDAATRKYGGTGLGLAIVNDLIQLQKGSIKVQSEPGKGTNFRVIIPYKIATVDMGMRNLDELNVSSFADVKILVAEDNEINQSLIKYLFKSWNLAYDLARNGKEAVELLQTKTYNLVLMDIQMPEMDGYTATGEIRHRLKLDIPIIAMTAHAFAGEREKCLSYGMSEYISKPIRERHLHDLLNQFIQKTNSVQPQKKRVEELVPGAYRYINLDYMNEISEGNKEYEKTVTEQFIEAIPRALAALEIARENKDIIA